MATDFGTDLNFDGLDISEIGDTVSGIDLLKQSLLIRLSTGRSVLDAPDDGIDLADELSRGMTPADVAGLGSRIQQEITKDERFFAARATVDDSNLLTAGELEITLEIDSALGPFSLVLGASAAGVVILGGA